MNMRNEKKKLEEAKIVIRAAIEDGFTMYSSIARIVDMKDWRVKQIIKEDKELLGLYKVRKSMIGEKAADNIQKIIEDDTHPKHYEASKFLATKYKTDFDEVLEKDDGEISIIGSDDDGEKSVKIVFKS